MNQPIQHLLSTCQKIAIVQILNIKDIAVNKTRNSNFRQLKEERLTYKQIMMKQHNQWWRMHGALTEPRREVPIPDYSIEDAAFLFFCQTDRKHPHSWISCFSFQTPRKSSLLGERTLIVQLQTMFMLRVYSLKSRKIHFSSLPLFKRPTLYILWILGPHFLEFQLQSVKERRQEWAYSLASAGSPVFLTFLKAENNFIFIIAKANTNKKKKITKYQR